MPEDPLRSELWSQLNDEVVIVGVSLEQFAASSGWGEAAIAIAQAVDQAMSRTVRTRLHRLDTVLAALYSIKLKKCFKKVCRQSGWTERRFEIAKVLLSLEIPHLAANKATRRRASSGR